MNALKNKTKDANRELEREREELFFLDNKMILNQFYIEKDKKDIENVNIIQGLERDVSILEFDKANMLLTNNIQQALLTKMAKEVTREKLRKAELYNQCVVLKRIKDAI